MPESSVSVSTPLPLGTLKPSAPRDAPPPPSFWTTGADVGSGHSAYGVGLVVLHARLTIAPLATFEPAAVATAAATVMCVASGMLVIVWLEFATVPVALVTGIVSCWPTANGLVLA